MKGIRIVALGVLGLIALYLVGVVVLKIFDVILNIEFDNIWYSAFKVEVIACALLGLDKLRMVRNRRNEAC